jgi:TolA-binding protein
MGYAYANLSQNDNARFYLQRLVEQYPASHSARLARERLQNLP